MLETTETCRAGLRTFFHNLRAGRLGRTGASIATRSFMFTLLTATVVAQFWTAPPASAQFVFFDLSTSANYVLVGGSATLTATYTLDVGPTPYYIEIFDHTTGTLLTACGSGTTCPASVTYNYPTTHTYVAYVARYGTTEPPPDVQQKSDPQTIVWQDTLVLNGPGAVINNRTGTLTASASFDVGPTPYYIEIFDQTSGMLVKACGFGTVCTAPVQIIQSCHTVSHTYIAYIADYSTTAPPPGIVATSNPWTVEFIGPPC
jgi:hypothetical protein